MDEEKELDCLFGENSKVEISLSYSRLSDFDRNGPSVLIKKSNIGGYGVTIGAVVDDLALPVKGFNFNDKYIVCDYDKPTAMLGALVEIILNNYTEIPAKDKILEICRNNSFWKASKDDTVMAKFDIPEFWQYLKIYIQGSTKDIISSSEKDKAEDLTNILHNHEFSKHIFNNDLENHNQFKLDFEYNGIKFKGFLDKLTIDHKNKTVQMIDLKTGKDDALKFMKSFIDYRYYLQEAVYIKGFNYICKQLKLKDYKLLPFQFLYIGRSEKIPLMYTMSSKWHKAATNGFNINQYTYKGLNELIEDVKWHFSKREFEFPRKIYENNGNIILNDIFIDINK